MINIKDYAYTLDSGKTYTIDFTQDDYFSLDSGGCSDLSFGFWSPIECPTLTVSRSA